MTYLKLTAFGKEIANLSTKILNELSLTALYFTLAPLRTLR